MHGTIVSINTSERKGDKKRPVERATLAAGQGISGDAHAGTSSVRQVSLLAEESIAKAEEAGLSIQPGDFAENMTVRGLELRRLPVGARLRTSGGAILQVSQQGKECHNPCYIGVQMGTCIMPTEGIFAQVAVGGEVAAGDSIELTNAKVGAVLTVSDRCSRGEREDQSGPELLELFDKLGVQVSAYEVIPDEEELIRERLEFLADKCRVDVILTSGGTGLSPRDITPEATAQVLHKQAPGIAEAVRLAGADFTPYSCLSRGVAGLRGRTMIINLPGSKKAVTEVSGFLAAVLEHALESLRGEIIDCSPLPPAAGAAPGPQRIS